MNRWNLLSCLLRYLISMIHPTLVFGNGKVGKEEKMGKGEQKKGKRRGTLIHPPPPQSVPTVGGVGVVNYLHHIYTGGE